MIKLTIYFYAQKLIAWLLAIWPAILLLKKKTQLQLFFTRKTFVITEMMLLHRCASIVWLFITSFVFALTLLILTFKYEDKEGRLFEQIQ